MIGAVKTVACCIGSALALVTGSACSAPSVDPGASVTGPGTLLAAWVARTLPPDAQLVVDDAATRTALARSGVTTTVQPPGAPGAVDRFRISDDAGRDVGIRGLTPTTTAVPVARFDGGDGSTLLVDRLVTGPAGDVATVAAQDSARRVAAGTALLGNPAVTVCDACRSVLSGGGLDLRAASLLAVLSTAGAVTVREIVADPAETGAGGPARSVVVGGASPGEVRALAGATVGGYRPSITAVTTTTTTLLWNLASPTTLTGVRP